MNQTHLMTVTEAAKRLACTTATVRKWIRDGVDGRRLKAYRLGGRWYVDEPALRAFLEGDHSTPSAPLESEEILRGEKHYGLA